MLKVSILYASGWMTPSIQDVSTQGIRRCRHGPDPWGANASNTGQVKRRSDVPLMNAYFTKESGKSHWTVRLGELMVWENLLQECREQRTKMGTQWLLLG